MKWISVEDKMPKPRDILILSDGESYSIGHFISEKCGWHWSQGNYLNSVKYWMPLPKVPNEMD